MGAGKPYHCSEQTELSALQMYFGLLFRFQGISHLCNPPHE
ncbi:hypothetical protein APHWEB_0864 [Anaplasma phagocytophilum str. Webster]|nr:hypothetical protein APHWEB_0864 [Anaplasma phagocytophilum str. Webster]